MRMYQMFETKEERQNWIKERKSKSKEFRVCFQETVKQLAKSVYLTDEQQAKYKYAVVYTYD